MSDPQQSGPITIPDVPPFPPLIRQPPGFLYHYTSQKGLLDMLKSESVWASHILFLNDSTEFLYAFSVLDEVIQFYFDNTTDPVVVQFLGFLREQAEQLKNINTYVFCLSEEGDLLSQWRGYSPNGQGIAYAFNSATLKALAREQMCFLTPCLYDRSEQMECIRRALDITIRQVVQAATGIASTGGQARIDDGTFAATAAQSFATSHFANIAPVLKHPDFREEHEWRIVMNLAGPTHKQIGFRAGTSTVTPYFDFQLKSPLRSFELAGVVIGPTPHPDLAEKGVNLLFASKKYTPKPFIRRSSIPFRSW